MKPSRSGRPRRQRQPKAAAPERPATIQITDQLGVDLARLAHKDLKVSLEARVKAEEAVQQSRTTMDGILRRLAAELGVDTDHYLLNVDEGTFELMKKEADAVN